METRAAWRGARACSSAVAGRARLRPFGGLPSFSRLEAGTTSALCWARERAEQHLCAYEGAALIHKRYLLLLSCILAALLYSPSKLSPFKSYQPKPQQPSTTLPHQQPPQCLSPDRKSYSRTAPSRLSQDMRRQSHHHHHSDTS